MLLDPAAWLASFMQLTNMVVDFKLFILILGIGYFLLAWVGEKHVFPRLAKALGVAKERMSKAPKRRKVYKVILGKMRI
jgi:cation-transporting ATPase 13A3/4/5